MQKITVEITANGYTGLTVENIERALGYYFGSERLGVSFSVTETTQQNTHLSKQHDDADAQSRQAIIDLLDEAIVKIGLDPNGYTVAGKIDMLGSQCIYSEFT